MTKKIRTFLFSNKTDKQTLIKNNIWLLISEIISKWMMFFIWIYVIRWLGPEGYGLLSYVTSIVTFLLIIIDSRMDQLFMRIWYVDIKKSLSYLRYFLFTKIILFIIIIWVLILFHTYISVYWEIIYLVWLLFLAWFLKHINTYIFLYYKVYEKMEIEGVLKIFNTLILGGTFFIPILYFWIILTVKNVLILFIFWATLNFLLWIWCLLLFIWNMNISFFEKNFLLKYYEFLFEKYKTILILLFSLFSVNLYYIWDQYILGKLWFMLELWVYAAYYMILINFLNIFRIFKSAINPRISRSISDEEKFKDVFGKFTKATFYLSTIVSITLLLCWEYMLKTLLWDAYVSGNDIWIYYILVFSVYLMTLTVNLSNTILLFNWHDKKFLIGMLSGGIFNIILNIFMIPHFWAIWAAIATLISVCFLLTYMTIIFPVKWFLYKNKL